MTPATTRTRPRTAPLVLAIALLNATAQAQPPAGAPAPAPAPSPAPAPAPAPASAPAPANDDPPPEYASLIEEGLAESAAQHWAEARALFRRAHRMFPNARTLRVIGMTSYELRDYPEAYRMLRASLVDARRPLTDAQRSEVLALLDRTQALLGRYALDAFPPDARIVVDGVEVHVAPGEELVLGTGDHTVDVRFGDERSVGQWTVQGGERGPLPVTRIEHDASPETVARMLDPGPSHRGRRIAGIATAVAGGALAGLGTFFVVRGREETNTVDDAAFGTPWSAVEDDFANGPRHVRLGATTLGLGVAAAAAGVVLAVRVPETRPVLTVRVGPTRVGAEVRF